MRAKAVKKRAPVKAKRAKKGLKPKPLKGWRVTAEKVAKTQYSAEVLTLSEVVDLRLPREVLGVLSRTAAVAGMDINTVLNVLIALSLVTAEKMEESKHGI